MEHTIAESFQRQAAGAVQNRFASEEAITAFTESYVALRCALDSRFREKVLAQENWNAALQRQITQQDFRPSMKEYLRSKDAKVLFPRVLMDQILEPNEPMFVGLNVIAKRMAITGPGNVIEWITTDAVVARWVDEGESAEREQLNFARHMDTIRIKKAMVATGFTDEMIADSQYPILEMHLRAMNKALNRLIEEELWTKAMAKAVTVFDNDGGTSLKGSTTGLSSAGATNNTMTVHDVLTLLAVPAVNGYVATDVIAHPLHVLGMLKDETLRTLLQFRLPTGLPQPSLDGGTYQNLFPYQIKAHMVPYVPSNAKTKASSAAFQATVFACDPNESLLWIDREAATMKEWENPEIDVQQVNIRLRGGAGVLHNGLGMAQAKAVSAEANYGPAILTQAVS